MCVCVCVCVCVCMCVCLCGVRHRFFLIFLKWEVAENEMALWKFGNLALKRRGSLIKGVVGGST